MIDGRFKNQTSYFGYQQILCLISKTARTLTMQLKDCPFLLISHLPKIGNVSELSGRSSDNENIRTENARNTVMPRDTFSPDSGGNQNINSAIRDNINEGSTMYITW